MLTLISDIINNLDHVEDALLIGLLETKKKSILKEQNTPKYAPTDFDINRAKSGMRMTLNARAKEIYPEDGRLIKRYENLIEKTKNQYHYYYRDGSNAHCEFKPHSKYVVHESYFSKYEKKTNHYSYCTICEDRTCKMEDAVLKIERNIEEKINNLLESPELKELIETKAMINILNRNLNNYKQNLKSYDAS